MTDPGSTDTAGRSAGAVPPAVVDQVARLVASSVLPGTVVTTGAPGAPEALDAALARHGFVARPSAEPGTGDPVVAVVRFAERHADLEGLLAQVGAPAGGPPLLVVAVPNDLSYAELATRLEGRPDRPPPDRDPLTAMARRAGFEPAVVADVDATGAGDRHRPTEGRALLAELARRVGHDPDVSHLVRSFRPSRPAELDPAPAGASCFLSVIVRTQGRRSTLVDTLTSLAAQRDGDLEVLVMAHEVAHDELEHIERLARSFPPAFADRVRVTRVTGGGRSAPLNAALDSASGSYVAILDDDDVVTSDWVAAFRRAADRQPGRVVRARCAVQSIERRTGELTDFEPVSGLDTPYPARFDLLDNIRSNRSPPCGYAIPTRLVDALALRFDDTLQVCEDWRFQLDAARLVGVSDDPAVTSVYRRWVGDGGSAGAAPEAVWIDDHYRVVDDLDRDHTIVPPGSLRRIHELYERVEQLEIELGRRAPGDPPPAFGPEPVVRSDRPAR